VSAGIWTIVAAVVAVLAGGAGKWVSQSLRDRRQRQLEQAAANGYLRTDGSRYKGTLERAEEHMADNTIHVPKPR
jgi:type II secretory pathway pseudopilin PulG